MKILNLAPLLLLSGFLTSCSITYHRPPRHVHHDPFPAEVPSVPEPALPSDDVPSDLKARFDAAKSITSYLERDKAMRIIAADAARGGHAELTKRALGSIQSYLTRDDAAEAAAVTLRQLGKRPAAVEVARMITSYLKRDAVLAELAK